MAQTSLKNEVWQSLRSNCIRIATFCQLPGTSVEVMLARAALLALTRLSYLGPASYSLSRKSNTLNGEGKHYGCNRSWNEIRVSPITTFLHVFAAAGKPFNGKPHISDPHGFTGMVGWQGAACAERIQWPSSPSQHYTRALNRVLKCREITFFKEQALFFVSQCRKYGGKVNAFIFSCSIHLCGWLRHTPFSDDLNI